MNRMRSHCRKPRKAEKEPRSVFPAALGRAILEATRGKSVPDDALPHAAEGFAHLRSSAELAEQARHRSLADRLRPAIDFTAVLLCGLRAARWQYSARNGLVASCVRSTRCPLSALLAGLAHDLRRILDWTARPDLFVYVCVCVCVFVLYCFCARVTLDMVGACVWLVLGIESAAAFGRTLCPLRQDPAQARRAQEDGKNVWGNAQRS